MGPASSAPIHDGARVRVPPPLVFVGATLVGVVLELLQPLATQLPAMLRIVAVIALVVFGLGVGLAANVLFRRTGQNPIPWKPTPELIARGPYRFTRNPMYVGMTALQIAVGVGVDSLWIVLLAIAALAIVHRTAVLPEETYLAAKFGESYRAYMAAVRRYL